MEETPLYSVSCTPGKPSNQWRERLGALAIKAVLSTCLRVSPRRRRGRRLSKEDAASRCRIHSGRSLLCFLRNVISGKVRRPDIPFAFLFISGLVSFLRSIRFVDSVSLFPSLFALDKRTFLMRNVSMQMKTYRSKKGKDAGVGISFRFPLARFSD